MSKRNLILFSPELPRCPRHKIIFNEEYDVAPAVSEVEFTAMLSSLAVDAAVFCLCSCREQDVETALRLNALAGPVPVLMCTKRLEPEFIRETAQRGVASFLVCNMPVPRTRAGIDSAIRDSGLRKYVESRWPGSLRISPHISKLVDEVIHLYPHRINVEGLAKRLEIDRGWLHKLCKMAFGISVITFLRSIRVHQALRMMQYTSLDNLEIAMQLDYSEESSMARDFRKELGHSPSDARRRLTDQTAEGLLL